MRRTSIEGENYRKRKRDSEDSYNLKSPQSFSKDTHSKFSFTDYKHSLNKVLLYNGDYNNVVSNLDDLWAFINKYEATLNRAGKPVILKDIESENNEIGVPKIYSKSHCINFTCKFKFTDSYTHNRDGKKLTKDIFESFLKIVAIYQDFKNKEKFAKLNKLRQAQRDLPVAQYRDDIVTAVKNQKVVVIAGDTGCGKSTQVPQYLHEAGFQSIACTQPRRIACVSLSKRVAFETLTQFQTQVGYQIRFEKSKTADTKICFITEGLLLRQMSSENMPSYDVIILDEIHERHLMGDFLLGVLKCLIHSRDDIKLVLMSATININLFEEYFAAESAAVIQVPGRLYPIDLHYKPIMIDQKPTRDDRLDPQPYVQIMQLIDNKYSSDERGDLLIFMSGVQEITAISDAALQYAEKSKKWIVLQLHSGLSLADQDKVFDYPPEGVRKCIVSTNIAETSVTIDGIRFVVDSGKVKEMSYDPSTKMQRLKEFWISKASADQRKGRAGRTGPGVCYRIYSEKQFSELDAYSTPEIARVPLASLLLLMTSLGMSDVRKFPFLDAPPSESIENALLELKQHGAISSNEKITALGKCLSNLPVEVALAKALIIGTSTLTYHKKDSALTLAAALGIRSIYTTKAHRDIDCETARKPSESDHGDPLCLLSLYCAWLTTKAAGRGQSRAWCRSRGIEEQRLYELTKLAAQLRALLQDNNLMELPIKDNMSSSERIQRHGEIKHLRDMRRKHKQKSAEDSKKKKRLKLDSFEIVDENTIHDEDSAIDIRDIEFRMTNDAGRIQALISGSNPSSGRDLVTLKLVLCRALYPQIAVADEFNHCKSEQLFHTWSKPYVFLHPTSYFGKQPRVLQLCESEIVTDLPMGYKNRLPLSAKHQLLCYLSLLETTKPYIVNSMRMPAAQTLLLLAHSIDSNMGFTRIVCDNWLLLEFPYPESGMNLLLKATQLRKRWDDLINSRLSDANPQKSVESELEKSKSKPKNKCYDELQHNLSCDLAHYMNSEVYYTIKKLLPGDLKVLYVGFDENSSFEVKPNPFEERFVCYPHEKKGGVCVTDNIVYNCITDSEWSYNNFQETYNTPYTCSACDFTLCLPPIERMQHKLFMCSKNNEIKPETSKIHQNSQNPNAKEYSCDSCKDILYLTPVQILKHKKSCEKNK